MESGQTVSASDFEDGPTIDPAEQRRIEQWFDYLEDEDDGRYSEIELRMMELAARAHTCTGIHPDGPSDHPDALYTVTVLSTENILADLAHLLEGAIVVDATENTYFEDFDPEEESPEKYSELVFELA